MTKKRMHAMDGLTDNVRGHYTAQRWIERRGPRAGSALQLRKDFEASKMNNIRLQRVLTSVSLVTQAFGFAMLGFLIALRGGSDSGARIGGLLAVLTGTMFIVAAIAYWRTCHRQTGQHLGVLGIQTVANSAAALAGLERRYVRPPHREERPHRQMAGVGGALLAMATNAFGAVS